LAVELVKLIGTLGGISGDKSLFPNPISLERVNLIGTLGKGKRE
jgi:hypothetical protein